MKKLLTFVVLMFGLLITSSAWAQSQVVSGTVKDTNGEALIGVSVTVKGTFVGTTTDVNGRFQLKVDFSKGPVTLLMSYVGFSNVEQELTSAQTGLEVAMEESSLMADEVIVSASRVEERIMETPVTVEKVGAQQLETQASSELFSSLGRFKGVDVNQSSLLISSLSTRGFNSAKSERVIQLADYVDYMSPSLSLYAGNVGGIPEVDIESVDIIHGANSALYGANAFNGVVITNSKDPFQYEGVTLSVRGGNRDLIDAQLRIAAKITDRLALKVFATYMEANDFIGQNQVARSTNIVPTNNPEGSPFGWDAMHRHGETAVIPANTLPGQTGAVFLPGFTEQDLMGEGFKASNARLGASLHYLITDKIQASYQYRLGQGSGIYQSSNRYAWDRLDFDFHKFEVKSDDWFVRVYRNQDQPGDTYDLNFLGLGMQVEQAYTPGTSPSSVEQAVAAANPGATYASIFGQTWGAAYGGAYASALGAGQTPDQAAATAAAAANTATANIVPSAGDPRFAALRQAGLDNQGNFNPSFQNNSWFWDYSGQYKLPIEALDVIVGASYRAFTLTSDGTLFGDGPNSVIGQGERSEIDNYEWGTYIQLKKGFIDNRLKLNFAGRLDNFQNFDSRFSPRFSAVYSAGADRQHNFRASYAQAFRAPTQVDQYIYLDIGSILLMGNIGENANQGYNAILLTDLAQGNFNQTFINPLDLEQMNTWEVGYKGILFDGFYVDLSYYRSNYTNFIGTQRFIGRESGAAPDPAEFGAIQAGLLDPAVAGRDRTRAMQVWLNADQEVVSQGFQIGVEYYIAKEFNVTANYTWSWIEDVEGLILGFNTPEHKINFGVNGQPFKNFNYNVNVRWQDTFEYFMPFDEGIIESFATVDAQVTYRVPKIYTTFKAGGTNLLDAEAIQVFGAAPIGRMYYVGATFDMNIFQKNQ